MPNPRPGFKFVDTVVNGHPTTLKVRDDGGVPEPTQAELEDELSGAVNLGWKTLVMRSTAGRRASVERFELFVDLKRWGRAWRRYPDGRVVRLFSTDRHPDEVPVPLGAIPARPDEPVMFASVATPDPPPADPNPFDEVDLATRQAIAAALGLRR